MAGAALYFGSLDMALLRKSFTETESKNADGMEGVHVSSSEELNILISEWKTSWQMEIKQDMKVRMLLFASHVKLIFSALLRRGAGKGTEREPRINLARFVTT
jgi:hypothetical protein